MQVKLLNSYPDESTAYRAAGICIGKQGTEKGMKSALSQGHMSIIEHLPMTFEINEVSRALTHQLVRHRIASYSQESQRYVTYTEDVDKLDSDITNLFIESNNLRVKEDDYFRELRVKFNKHFIVPPTLVNDREKLYQYMAQNMMSLVRYLRLVEEGCEAEDARFLLPNAFKTNIVMSINARTMINICQERLCEQAQWEIRELFKQMKECIKEVYPTVYSYCKPKCNNCKETRPCIKKKSDQVKEVKKRG